MGAVPPIGAVASPMGYPAAPGIGAPGPIGDPGIGAPGPIGDMPGAAPPGGDMPGAIPGAIPGAPAALEASAVCVSPSPFPQPDKTRPAIPNTTHNVWRNIHGTLKVATDRLDETMRTRDLNLTGRPLATDTLSPIMARRKCRVEQREGGNVGKIICGCPAGLPAHFNLPEVRSRFHPLEPCQHPLAIR
jgi:hypothetical protein